MRNSSIELWRGLFHPGLVTDAEAIEKEENGAKDGLKGSKHGEPSERSINCQTEIPAAAEDIQLIRGTEAEGFAEVRASKYQKAPAPIIEIPKLLRPAGDSCQKELDKLDTTPHFSIHA
jgi:hypothetical protein